MRWLALVLLAACGRVGSMAPGKVVRVEELYPDRATLRDVVARELDDGDPARAFYVLEVEKTRAYGAAWIASRAATDRAEVAEAYRDLRPLFAVLTEPDERERSPQRAIRRRPAGPGATAPIAAASSDDRYWHDIALYEARLHASVPYGDAARGHVAPVTSEEARLLFADDEVFVSFFVHRARIRAFVLWRGELHVHDLFADAPAIQTLSAALLDQVRDAPATPDDATWRDASQALAAKLIAPLPELADPAVRAIYISPDKFLACVPFGLLIQDGKMLLERARVTSLISATAYRKTIERGALDDPPAVLAVGNPTYPDGVPALPMADGEADTVSDAFDTGVLLRGADATERHVIDAMAESNILHLATHGVILGDVVAGASSLLLTADGEDDGFLSVAEISRLDLGHVYLAVLSACETSVGASEDDATDLSSLLGAFLGAGVRTVIGTLWPVADQATLGLTLEFYEHFLDEGAGEALRQAQLRMARSPRFGHPYYWAAFVLAGWDK